MKKKVLALLCGVCSLVAVSVYAGNNEVCTQEPVSSEYCAPAPCDTTCNPVPCNPCDTTCTPVPCNPAPCNPAPCNPGGC